MNELILSVSGSGLLTGLAVRFVASVAKKAFPAIRDLFSEDEAKAILAQAFLEFKESSIEGKCAKDEKILLEVFEEFFTDDRTAGEFRLVFDAQGEKVDFNLLEEIFVGICIEKGIEIPAFNFFRAVSHVIKEVERLAQKEEKFKGMFQTAHLGEICSSLQQRGTEPNMTFARFKYLNQLIKHNNRLLFAGIPDLRENKDIELPAVFVMPRVKENVPVEDYSRLMVEKQGDDEFTGEEIQLRRMMMSKKEEEKAPVKFDKVFKKSPNRRFVVLGKPGSGKSTLLKYLMLEASRLHLEYHRDSDHLLFPILVEIRKLEHAFSKTKEPGYNILDFLYDSMRTHYNLTLPEGFFEKYLDNGRALLMFDGLDEVAAEGRRAEIRQMIASFVTGHHMGNTVIVTSRIAGYSRAQFSTTEYRHFTLEDFDDEEIAAFIHRWYCSRLINEAEAETKAADLEKAFEKKPRIKELARNPLLLTIIGIIHRYEAQLPEDRLVLYDKATEALLYTWDNVKEIIDKRFKLSHRQRFLGQVAFHLQSMEKGDEAGTMIDRTELYKILLADFCKIFNCEAWEAQELVNDFLEMIRSRAGLLVELGPDRFGFAHKTFQEYFAARWIANETTLKFNLQIMINYVDKFIDNAFWHETLILALQGLPEEQALNVLKHILDRDTRKIEPYFYHNHYFVMKFIAEKGEWLNDKEFIEIRIDDFFRFSWNEGKGRGILFNYTWERFIGWVSSVSDSLVGSILSGKFISIAEDEKQDGYIRRSCAKAVGELGMKARAVEIFLNLAEDENQPGDLRRSCTEAMVHLGLKDKAVEILLRIVEDENQIGDLRISCAYAMGESGVKDKAVVERLLNLAEDEQQEGNLRRYCAEAMGNLGLKDEAVEILLLLTEDAKLDGGLRNYYAFAAGHLGLLNKVVVERLLNLVEDKNQNGDLRISCAYAMGESCVKDKAVVERLLNMAEDEKQEGNLRRYCAEAMGNLGLNDKAVEILLLLAEDAKQDGGLRNYCAFAVSHLGLMDKAVVERLLNLAEDEKQGGELRLFCSEAVGHLGLKNKAMVERLLNLAEDEKQAGDLRRSCTEAVGHVGLKNKAVVERLFHLAADESQDGDLQRECAEAVGRLGLKDKAVEILLHLAEDENRGGSLRSSCAEALGKLGEKDKAVDILLKLAQDANQDGYVRRSYALAVGKLGLKDKAVEILLHLAEDEKQDSDIRHSCAQALGVLGMKSKAVDILINLYLAQTDKYEFEAQSIYDSLWELTAL